MKLPPWSEIERLEVNGGKIEIIVTGTQGIGWIHDLGPHDSAIVQALGPQKLRLVYWVSPKIYHRCWKPWVEEWQDRHN